MTDTLKRYRDWAPSTCDSRGLGLPDRQDWIVLPACRTRDSGILESSNFHAVIKACEAAGVECEEHSFGHWACGLIEIILCEPTDAGERLARSIVKRLDSHPILDEDDHSMREHDAICAAWDGMSLRERIEECAAGGVSIFAARRESVPEGLYDSGRVYRFIGA